MADPLVGDRIDQPPPCLVAIDQLLARDIAVVKRHDPRVAVELGVNDEARREARMHRAEVTYRVPDVGAVHTRLAPGFVVDSKLDGDARIVTFHNGNVAREQLVDCDDARRRLVYAIANERVSHYSASVQVVADGENRSRLIWIVDVLPNAMASYIDGQMDLGAQALQKTLNRKAA